MARKKIILPAFILIIAAAIVLFRSTPTRVESVPENRRVPVAKEAMVFPSKENVSKAFLDHVEMLKKKLAAKPNDLSTLKTLGQWLMDAHRIEEAITYFERGVKLQPHNDSLLLDLSVCYFQLHRYEKAMQTTEQILRRHPQHPRALLNKGVLFAVQNKPNEATTIWNRLINHSPGTEEAEQARQYLAQLKRQ